jgi:uridine kinase
LKIEHSLGDGLYCTDLAGQNIPPEWCEKLGEGIKGVLDSDVPIELLVMSRDVLVKVFIQSEQWDKVGVLKTWQQEETNCIKCGDFLDYILEPCSTDKARLRIFEVRPYADGLVLRFATRMSPNAVREFTDPIVLHKMFKEYSEWARLIECDYVSKLNEIIYKRKIDDLKWLAEMLHESKISDVAEVLANNFAQKRIVTIAGPSSSNKTTFAKRLAIALRVLGHESLVIEMDDYFHDTADIPVGEDGLQDFEHISALNTKLLGNVVSQLLAGEKVPRRRFVFKDGKGVDSDSEFLRLKSSSFLIIEGIHGMNPICLDALGGQDRVCPIYVSCLTPLNIDSTHRFPTASLRCIRRMVRDYRYRGQSPRATLQRWGSVRRGEEMNIFPYQQNAELWFNSALVYEVPVLSTFARGLLAEASMPADNEDPESEETKEVTKDALRLQQLLSFFYPVSVEAVPHISCIREFVGGSDLKY